MDARFILAVLLGLVGATPVSATAQWAAYSAAPIPRTPEGDPDMAAPVPRTPEGRPDFTGVWRGVGALGRGGASGLADGPPLAGFRDVGTNVEGGLPLLDQARELRDRRIADNSRDNPEAHCLPMGIMQFHTQGAPRKFVQTPTLLVILYEASSGIRQVFLDGRSAPANDPQPWWYGYSVGRWEGDTLVVETTGLRDGGWLDISGSPLTDQATITERVTRTSYGQMTIDVTVDDPGAYTEPWTVRVVQELMPGDELIEFICLENQRFGVE